MEEIGYGWKAVVFNEYDCFLSMGTLSERSRCCCSYGQHRRRVYMAVIRSVDEFYWISVVAVALLSWTVNWTQSVNLPSVVRFQPAVSASNIRAGTHEHIRRYADGYTQVWRWAIPAVDLTAHVEINNINERTMAYVWGRYRRATADAVTAATNAYATNTDHALLAS